ncbi:MAG: ATP-binding protein [Thermoproteales archaeon]|nr:ATP-binding protein [Thermoproteales archaeon]
MREYLLTKKEDIRNLNVLPRETKIFLSKNFINSIVGPRRSGKTYFLYHLILNELKLKDEDYLFVNFEEESVRSLDRKEILDCIKYHQEIYGKLPKFLFFDEVQNLDRWESWIYELYEKKRFYIFITGSSSKLLSREIATQLRGRAINVPIFPFSFREFLNLKDIRIKRYYSSYERGKLLNLLREYLEFGGYPQILIDNINPKIFFRDYIDVVIYRDIVERYWIKEPEIVKLLIKFVASSLSSQLSINRIFNVLKSHGIKLSKKTLYSYFKYLENAFFCFSLKKFAFSERKSELSIPKVYLSDTGIANYLLKTKISENIGQLMENVVFLELKKNELLGEITSLFYYKDYQQREVDFLVKEGSKIKQLIQVTYANTFDEIKEEEYRNLLHVKELFKDHNPKLIIITWDYEDERELSWFGRKGKIKFIPLWKWLMKT